MRQHTSWFDRFDTVPWCFGCSNNHLGSCPGAWHHAHSWWAASQLPFLENENLKIKSRWNFKDVPALDPDQSFLRGWAESPRESGLQVEPQPTPASKLFCPILQNTDFIVWPVLHFCKAFIAGKFNNADNNSIIKVSPQLRRNVSLGPGKSLQFQSDEDDFSYKSDSLDQTWVKLWFVIRKWWFGSSLVHVGLG